ncbi:hypothetical protein HY449_01730 [Candidatus Pacearchaeota archaeon]|nr:hypothetical protein [Candidatus Pacearchaeota archaeon]
MVKGIESKVAETSSFWEGFDWSFGYMPNPKEVVEAVRQLPEVMREIRDNRYERRERIGCLTGAALDVLVTYVALPGTIGHIIYDIFK